MIITGELMRQFAVSGGRAVGLLAWSNPLTPSMPPVLPF